ncbi:MAG: class I SAM-dependent methyltransferase [Verrucomicrobiales bacterium]
MGHQESYYKHNEAYADFLANWDAAFYRKYTDSLKVIRASARLLDVGCGAGQVVKSLDDAGYQAYGVDVSEPNIAYASKVSSRCQVYDGKKLPFADRFFAAAGALNVLEHVEEPEAFIREVVRVVEPGGRVVISSPNFLRVLGFRDYHPKMRGIGNKLSNLKQLLSKRRLMRANPSGLKFNRMEPIIKEPFTPDDDAIVATNALEISFFLEQAGCEIVKVNCTDRYVAKPIAMVLDHTPLRYLMFNAFVVARKK